MEGAPGPATGRQGPNRGLLWGLIIAVLVLAAGVAGCSCEEAVTVPNVVGMEEIEARDALSDADLELGDVERLAVEADAPEIGTVLSQLPSAGTEVDAGAEVALVVAETSEETSEEDEAETPAAGSGGGSGAGDSPGSGADTGGDAGTDAEGAWHTVAADSGTRVYYGPTFTTTSTQLELTVTVSTVTIPTGVNMVFWFVLVDVTSGSDTALGIEVTGTTTPTTHAFEPVSVPPGTYRMEVRGPGAVMNGDHGEKWSFTLREWSPRR